MTLESVLIFSLLPMPPGPVQCCAVMAVFNACTLNREKVMMETGQPPGFWSREFHTRFFPSVLRLIIRPRNEAYESPFARHGLTELTILLAVSLLACIFGYAAAVNGSLIGAFIAFLATAGIVFLVVHSLRSRERRRPSWQEFRIGIFFFVLFLCFTAGLAIGQSYHAAYGVRLMGGLAGIAVGYFFGIACGLGAQYLGWLGEMLDLLAGIALAGIIIVDILLML